MRFLALAALMPVACLALAQDTSVHVTYVGKAMRASEAVKALGALAKVDLQTSPQTENEVLVISVKDIPLTDVMARIATATSGEWKQEGATYRLIASAAMRNKEGRIEVAKKLAEVEKAIQDRGKNHEKMQAMMAEAAKKIAAKGDTKGDAKADKKTDGDDDTEGFTGMADSPDENTITKLLQLVDPEALAGLGAGDRIVFSTDPTKTQKGFSGTPTEIINEFIQAHNVVTTNQTDDVSAGLSGLTDEQAAAIKGLMKQRTGKIGQVSKALLIASRMGFGIISMNQLELRLYDAKGVVVFSTSSQLSMGDNDMSELIAQATAAATGQKTAPKAPEKTTPVEYSDDSKALQAISKNGQTGNFRMNLGDTLRRKLFLPSLYDPLSYDATDELLSYAKSMGKPVVADLPDDAADNMQIFMPTTGTTVEDYAKKLAKGTTLVSVPDDQFTVIKPAYPSLARAERLDRGALTTLLQAVTQKEIPSLDDLSAYALQAPDPMQGGIGQIYLMLFVPGAVSMGLDGMTSWEMLRFYGGLAPESKATLLNGGKLSIGGLSGVQRAAAEQMTYGSMAQLSVDDPNHKTEDDQPFWMRMMGGGSGGADYRSEPTEVVPNGLPSDGYIDMKGKTEQFASPVPAPDAQNIASIDILGPQELAMFKMFKEDKAYASFAGQLPSFPQLRIGDRTVYNFTFHLTPQVTIKQSLKDHRLPKDAQVVAENALPADLQKQVQDELTALKKSPLGAASAFMGAGQAIHP